MLRIRHTQLRKLFKIYCVKSFQNKETLLLDLKGVKANFPLLTRCVQSQVRDSTNLHSNEKEKTPKVAVDPGKSAEEQLLESNKSFSAELAKLAADNYREQVKDDLYFQEIIDSIKARTSTSKPQLLLEDVSRTLLGDDSSELPQVSPENAASLTPKIDMETLLKMKPNPPTRVRCLSAFANHSKNIHKLIELGIDVNYMRFNKDIGRYILRMNFEQDFVPRLFFFKDLGFETDKIAKAFNDNPFLFVDPIQDFEETVDYFKSKKFSAECIRDVISATPKVLTTPVKLLDKHLGFVQFEFKLSGDEVREVLSKAPKLFETSNNEIKVGSSG